MIYEEDIRRMLVDKLNEGGYTKTSKEMGMDRGFLSRVVNRKKPVSENLAKFFGYKKKVIFVKDEV
ncbi:MAG: hypothetical protein CBC71_06140 [Rhodobacteraceae bacterium TMED111]|nr:hypothetical protein [Marinovum sp.]OUV41079.1 MAG: hypothetical protein CBC71_06140 [Rhodobacteraceae bacterium TMED111]